MMKRRDGHGGLLAKVAILLAAAAVLFAETAAATSSTATPALDQKTALALSQSVVGQPVGDHVFTDASGRSVRLSELRGRPLVVNFVYTGCYHVCPTTTRFLRGAVKLAQDALGTDAFTTLTIGFNLPFDTPVAMRAFAKQQGVDLPRWIFASPDAGNLDRLLRDFGFSYAPTPSGFDHVLQVTVVDASGRIYRQLYGDSFDLPLLVQPLKELITGTPVAAPTIEAWFERVKLLCTVYDPSAGRYRINYAVVIEIFVGASVLLIGLGALAFEWRRQRRARRAV
jgi:protein SCO1/2